jgi:hypothetical protein
MKDIRPALRDFLLADPTISGLVGGVRVHHIRLPQDQVQPSVVYTKISEIGDYHMQSDSGLGQLRMQVDAWAQDPDQATQLANAVYDRLTGERGIVDTIDFRGAFLTSGRDDFDEITKLFRISRDFTIWYGVY